MLNAKLNVDVKFNANAKSIEFSTTYFDVVLAGAWDQFSSDGASVDIRHAGAPSEQGVSHRGTQGTAAIAHCSKYCHDYRYASCNG